MTLTQSLLASGDSPVPDGLISSISGNSCGNSSSGMVVIVPSSQCIIGIGSPQYRCLENSQSRRRYVTSLLPFPVSSSQLLILAMSSSVFNPFKNSELICLPSPEYASFEMSPQIGRASCRERLLITYVFISLII